MSPSEQVAPGTPIICHLSDILKVLANIYFVRQGETLLISISYISFFLIFGNNVSCHLAFFFELSPK